MTYRFGVDFFGIEGFEELRGSLQFQALLGDSEVAHAVLPGPQSQCQCKCHHHHHQHF